MNNKTKKKTHGGNLFNRLFRRHHAVAKNIARTIAVPKQNFNPNRLNKHTDDAVEKYYNWYYRKHIPKNNWKGNETDRQIINRLFRERQDTEQYGTTIDNYFRNKMTAKNPEIKEPEISEFLQTTIHPQAKIYLDKIKTNLKETAQRSSIEKTWDYIKFAVYTTKKSLWDNPIQVQFLNKTETFSALSNLININLTWDPNADKETMNKNYNDFYKNLIGTVLPILESTFDEYLKGGCEKTVPFVFKHIFGDNMIAKGQHKINDSEFAQSVLDKTYQTCNTIVPKIANQLKTHGFAEGILSKEVKKELIQYMDETIGLCKDIIIGVIEKKLTDFAETTADDIKTTVDDLLNKEITEEMIKKIFLKIKTEIDKFEKMDVKHTVTTMIANLNSNEKIQGIEQGIEQEIAGKLETKVGKITIYDFYKNWRETTTNLLDAWTTEISEAIPDKENRDGYYKAKCLMNVLDLRLSTIIDNVCKIYKSDSLLCDEELIKGVDDILTKDDIKSVLKKMSIHAFQTKKAKLLQELTFFEESIVLNYLALPHQIVNRPSGTLPPHFYRSNFALPSQSVEARKRENARKTTQKKTPAKSKTPAKTHSSEKSRHNSK